MIRTFLAIDLPTSILRLIRDRQQDWKSAEAAVRWVKHTRLHVTLRFLGDVPQERLADVAAACRGVCSRFPSFSLSLNGTGVFPTLKRPRVLWIGLGGDTDSLCALQNRLEVALESRGFPGETRPFSPHLTVGRVRGGRNIQKLVDIFTSGKVESESFEVKEVVVYESTLTPQGPVYSDLARCPLG